MVFLKITLSERGPPTKGPMMRAGGGWGVSPFRLLRHAHDPLFGAWGIGSTSATGGHHCTGGSDRYPRGEMRTAARPSNL